MVSQNSNTDMITVNYNAIELPDVSASLFDINGRLIANKSSKNALSNSISFEGSTLKSGVYFVKISYGKNSTTKKIIKK